jgi:oligoribonuclease
MEKRFVWMDLEMSGLDPETDVILEIATIITNENLDIIATGPELVIKREAKLFDSMDDWNQKQHTKSGLWKKVLNSQTSNEEAEAQTLAFIKENCKKRSILAGNSIWQDRRFLNRYMPKISDYLHYRMLDVSAVKICAKAWYRNLEYKKDSNHRALDDIKESINELKFYRQAVFKSQAELLGSK